MTIGLIFPPKTHASFVSFVSDIFNGTSQAQADQPTEITQKPTVLEAPLAPDPNAVKAMSTDVNIDDAALMTETGPSGTAADISGVDLTSNNISLYVVHSGDSLQSIAKMTMIRIQVYDSLK